MGLFSKVFSKETCIACGKEAGSLNRKRLGDDSVVCKDCARQLSPYFSDFKSSTADDIRTQLDARARNRDALPSFHVDEAFGEGDQLLIDQRQGLFCVVSGMGGKTIASGAQLVDANPDLIALSAIQSVEVEGAGHSGREVKHTENGQQVSYSPRRYEYPCNVRLHLSLDHPYVKSMSADMTNGTIYIQTEGERLRDGDVLRGRSAGQATADWLLGRDYSVENAAESWDDKSLGARMRRPLEHAFGNVLDDHPDYAYGFRCSRENWPRIQEYGRCMELAERAREALLAGGESAPQSAGDVRALASALLGGMDDAGAQAMVDACGIRAQPFKAGETVVAANTPLSEAGFVASGRVAAGAETFEGEFGEVAAVEVGHSFLVNVALIEQSAPVEYRATQDSVVVFFRIDRQTAAAYESDRNFALLLSNAIRLQ